MTRIVRNEPTAAKRRIGLYLFQDDGVTPVDPSTQFGWVAASLALSGLSAAFASATINWNISGAAANGTTIQFAADGTGSGNLTSSGSNYVFHFQSGVTTCANAVAALSGDFNFTGTFTGSTLLAGGDVFGPTALTGGQDATVGLRFGSATQENFIDRADAVTNVQDDNAVPIPGYFVLQMTQAEVNFSGNELGVRVAKPGVKAALNVGAITTHCNDTVEDTTAGSQGNNTTLAFVADGSGTGSLDESGYPAIVFHYQSGTTTVANFEAHVAASTHLDVKTAGTAANVLSDPADTFAAHKLSGGIGYTPMLTSIQMIEDSLDYIGEGAHTVSDLIRLMTSVLGGKVADFRTGSLAFRDLGDSKTRLTVSTDASGRTAITVGDLTP